MRPRIRSIFSRPRFREGLASSSSPLLSSGVRCARRALFGVESSPRSSRFSACSVFPRLRAADRSVVLTARGVSTVGFVTALGATGALAFPASLGVVGMVVALLVGADAG